jgi:2-dehydropantoate 2-reductase
MRIVVVGPGALGCLLAGFLSRKAEVWLLDHDPARAERIIKNQGISCQGISGKWQAKIPATAKPEDIGEADLVIICTKAYDTKDAIILAQPLVKEKTLVLTMQNGIGNVEVISEIIGEERVLAGITHHAVTLLGEASIEHTGSGETIIGHLEGRMPAAIRNIRELFNKAKIETAISRNIKGALWSKLVINAGINALSGITRLKNGQLTNAEELSELLRASVVEAVKVAKKKHIKLIYDDPLSKIDAVCQMTANNVSSMLQDILAKKRTEIDYINGVIVKQGKMCGVPTPVNYVLYQLVKAVERSYEKTVPTPVNP